MNTRIRDCTGALVVLVLFALNCKLSTTFAQVNFSGFNGNIGFPNGYPTYIFTDPSNTTELVDYYYNDDQEQIGIYLGADLSGILCGTLTISDGAVLNDGGAQIGVYEGHIPDTNTAADAATVIVDGVGSVWNNCLVINEGTVNNLGENQVTSNVFVQNGITLGGGCTNISGYLTIQNGGAVHSYGGNYIGGSVDIRAGLGGGPGSYGSVVVNGSGSTWTISPLLDPAYPTIGLQIGDWQSGGPGGWGQLTITNGGTVWIGPPGGGNLGVGVTSSGMGYGSSVVVDGNGSTLIITNGTMYFSFPFESTPYYQTTPATSMTIRNGGYVYDQSASIECASVTVDNATWTNSGGGVIGGIDLEPGPIQATLAIQNGGKVYNVNNQTLLSDSALTVSGQGSELAGNFLQLGSTSGSTVLVENGGSIECSRAAGLGYAIEIGPGDIITVEGTNSSLLAPGGLIGLGENGNPGGTLVLLNGSSATANTIYASSLGTLTGNGTVNGNVSADGSVVPGNGSGGIGALAVNGNLSWGSSSNSTFLISVGSNCDQVIVSSNLYLAGTLNISVVPGVTTGAYTLFTYGGKLQLARFRVTGSPGFGYTLNTNTPGEVNVVLTSNPPIFTSASFYSGAITLNGASGFPNQIFYVIASTNVALPFSKWQIVATNQFDGAGDFSLTSTMAPDAPQQFYSIKMAQ